MQCVLLWPTSELSYGVILHGSHHVHRLLYITSHPGWKLEMHCWFCIIAGVYFCAERRSISSVLCCPFLWPLVVLCVCALSLPSIEQVAALACRAYAICPAQ